MSMCAQPGAVYAVVRCVCVPGVPRITVIRIAYARGRGAWRPPPPRARTAARQSVVSLYTQCGVLLFFLFFLRL